MTPLRAELRKAFLLAILLASTAAPDWGQTPDQGLFRVNTVTVTWQQGPVVGMDAAGRAVVLWTDSNQEPNGIIHPRIAGQRFDPRGGRLGSEFVSNDPPFDAGGVNGTVLQSGAEFTTLWDQAYSHCPSLFCRRAAGQRTGSARRVGVQVGYYDGLMGFGGGVKGELVGVWQRSFTGDPRPPGFTFARWFDRNGAPLSNEIVLPGAISAGRPLVDVVAGPHRSVLVGWTVSDPDERVFDLHVQAYSASGEKLGPEFFVPQIVRNPQAGMAWNPLTRTFVVAWREIELLAAGYTERMLLQNLNANGQPARPQPIAVSETGGIPAAVACNVRGYCAVTWFRERVGIVVRIVRPDARVLPQEVLVGAVPAYPTGIAYGGNGALMIVWTDDYSGSTDPADIAARRLIASPGDEICQRVGNEVRCDAGRTGSLPELRLAPFGLDRREILLFGDVDGDGRADPCRVRNGTWRCDTDHEGEGAEATLRFTGSGGGTPLLGDVDGDGTAEACTWAGGVLRCDTGHDGGAPEVTLAYGGRKETPHLADLDGDGRDDLCLGSRASLRCDVGHDGGRTEIRLAFGEAGDQLAFGDFDADGSDDPCVARAGKLLCDTAHDGGAWEAEILLGTPGAPVLLGNLDGV